jgi:hypothetical protein
MDPGMLQNMHSGHTSGMQASGSAAARTSHVASTFRPSGVLHPTFRRSTVVLQSPAPKRPSIAATRPNKSAVRDATKAAGAAVASMLGQPPELSSTESQANAGQPQAQHLEDLLGKYNVDDAAWGHAQATARDKDGLQFNQRVELHARHQMQQGQSVAVAVSPSKYALPDSF